jgi:hypothetical protein
MGLGSYILIGYIAGAVLTGVRLGWHMAFRIDRFDWIYSKSNIWMSFVLSTLLWPLILMPPRNLIEPAKLFEGSFGRAGLAARAREEERLQLSPPPCGAVLLYRQGRGGYEETFGEFTFRSVDVEEALVGKLRDHPHLAADHEGSILKWLRQRDESITTPTPIPAAWSRFQYIADDLLRNGRGEAHCLACNKPIPKNEWFQKDDQGRSGWNFNKLVCPNNHRLLVVERIHLVMCAPNDVDQSRSA